MKILVTGATGFTGHNLCKRLLHEGHDVRILVRSKERVQLLPSPNLEIIEGDIRDEMTVNSCVEGTEKIFNIAAMFRSAKSVDQDYHDIHVGGVKHLLKAARRHDVKRIVHCSTVGVHGDIKIAPADENAPFAPADIYQRTKLEGELWAREYAHKHNLHLSVIRPTAIYGPGDMRLLKLFKLANQTVTPIIGSGEIYYHMVYIDDLVEGFILAGEIDAAVGEVFIIGGEEKMKLIHLLKTISKITKGSKRRIHLPVRPFQLAGTLCEKICIPLNIEPPIHRRRVDFFTKSRSFCINKAKRLLHYKPKYDLHTGLSKTAAWYSQQALL